VNEEAMTHVGLQRHSKKKNGFGICGLNFFGSEWGQ
jgi:hypothetical protein